MTCWLLGVRPLSEPKGSIEPLKTKLSDVSNLNTHFFKRLEESKCESRSVYPCVSNMTFFHHAGAVACPFTHLQ